MEADVTRRKNKKCSLRKQSEGESQPKKTAIMNMPSASAPPSNVFVVVSRVADPIWVPPLVEKQSASA